MSTASKATKLFRISAGWATVGGEGGVEVVVELVQDGDGRGVVELFVFVVEGFASAEFFKDVTMNLRNRSTA